MPFLVFSFGFPFRNPENGLSELGEAFKWLLRFRIFGLQFKLASLDVRRIDRK